MQTFDQALFDLYEADLISKTRCANADSGTTCACRSNSTARKETDPLSGIQHLDIV